MRVILAEGKKPWHGEIRFGGAYEITIGVAARRHHTEHRGRPTVVTSHTNIKFFSYGCTIKKCSQTWQVGANVLSTLLQQDKVGTYPIQFF